MIDPNKQALREELAILEAALDANGGRGVELAERIDELHALHMENTNKTLPDPTLDALAASTDDRTAASLATLALTFPTLSDALRNRYIITDSDVRCYRTRDDLLQGLKAVKASNHVGDGCRHAAAFCLGVYNDRAFPGFDVFKALTRWDNRHRAAFVRWAADPQWM
jgi:hypothetical protein